MVRKPLLNIQAVSYTPCGRFASTPDIRVPFDSMTPGTEPPMALRSSRLAGIALVVAVVLIQLLGQTVANRDWVRLASVLFFFAMEMPPLMLALSAFYRWARKRGLGAWSMACGGLTISALIGMACAALFWELTLLLPELRLRLSSTTTLSALRSVIFGLTNGLGHFGLWTLAFALPRALDDARIRALEADKLRLEAEQLRTVAELARLRGHLEPHFLLNTLNAIAGLVTEDARAARRLLVCLGDLLRDALREEGELQTLEEQVAWLKRYAEILETRHHGSLAFRWELDPLSAPALVPRLLLQPLVENAVKHGALKRPNGGEVSIRVGPGADASSVVCTIEDNGPGMPAELRSGASGLALVRRRLELRYPSRSSLNIESSPAGTRSVVRLPRELAADRSLA